MDSLGPKTIGLISLFNIVFLVLCWIVNSRLFWSKNQLKKHGYSEQLINVQKRNDNRYLKLTVLSFIAGQIVGIIVYLYMGYTITTVLYFPNISNLGFISMGIALLVSWPFFNKKYKSECRETAIKTNTKIIIDYNHSVLKLILNPWLESTAIILMLYFNIKYLGHDFYVYANMAVPSVYFYIMKQSKFQVQASIRYSYKVVSILMIIFQFWRAFKFTLVLNEVYSGNYGSFGSQNLILLGGLYIIFAATVILDIINYPRMKKMFINTLPQNPADTATL